MQHHHAPAARRAGFTLIEILVALALIALLAGTLLPSVLSQLGRGEVNRVVEDLRGVESATKAFRVDVNRWPGDLHDVTNPVSGTDSVLGGGSYPPGLMSRWAGPYLEGVTVADNGRLGTAAGGMIVDNFSLRPLGTQSYLAVATVGLSRETARGVSAVIDGDTVLAPGATGGRVVMSGDTLYYLAAPAR